MRKLIALSCLALLVAQTVCGEDQKPDLGQLKRDLEGTWECVSFPEWPKEIMHIKHVTPTHYTWVTFDRETNSILSTSGGKWSIKDDKYTEVCEFASDSHQHLRAKTFTFAIKVAGDKWDLSGVPGTEIEVNEVWKRMKLGELQKTNTERVGQELLGTWESTPAPESPKAMRTVKHVTRTHWTWVAYDRENKMILAAAGGSWSLKNGKYEEACEFTTANFPQARGKAYAYKFKVDDDRWTITGGTDLEDQVGETWKRLK
jgi:hypothetical protein